MSFSPTVKHYKQWDISFLISKLGIKPIIPTYSMSIRYLATAWYFKCLVCGSWGSLSHQPGYNFTQRILFFFFRQIKDTLNYRWGQALEAPPIYLISITPLTAWLLQRMLPGMRALCRAGWELGTESNVQHQTFQRSEMRPCSPIGSCLCKRSLAY